MAQNEQGFYSLKVDPKRFIHRSSPNALCVYLLEASLLLCTGKSLSEALIFASTNPQYDYRLFIVHENCKLRIPAEYVVYTNCCFCFVLTFRTILVHNMFYRCCELLKKIYLYQIKPNIWNLFKVVLIELWPCLFTTKLSYAQLFKWVKLRTILFFLLFQSFNFKCNDQ